MLRVLGHSMEFRWRFFTIVILYLTICLTSICSETAASIKSPGETTSRIEIRIGDSANITCNITKDLDISSIWFEEINTKRKILQNSSDITILGDQTAILTIRNASDGEYHCMSGYNGIGITKVYVGTPPVNVTNFKCKGYDFLYMICGFTPPPNKVLVNYTLTYRKKGNEIFNCKLDGAGDTQFCYFTGQLLIPEIFYFQLIGTNALGTSLQNFPVSNFRSVIPPKLKISFKNITSESVTLHWEINRFPFYEALGLEYEIRLKPKAFDWYNVTYSDQCQTWKCNYTINLTYPYRDYEVIARVRVKNGTNDDSMWSEPYEDTFRTKARRPDAPPTIPVGSFYIDPTEKYLRLYWQQVPEYKENGPNFHYVINKTYLNGTVFNETYTTKEANITFAWNCGDNYNFYIKSRNDYGESDDSSEIHVNPITAVEYLPKTIVTAYHNPTYTISWKPPKNHAQIMNYTVFWCISKTATLSECKGTIHFKYIDNSATNFTTDPQDHTINLAVSANYHNSITGMQWAKCSKDISSDLTKLDPKATAVSASKIKVHWSPEFICTAIVKGYNLTYCLLPENDASTQASSLNCHNVTLAVMQEYEIEGLKAYSKYRIDMLMYSEAKVGPRSDPVYVTTEQAAPSSPINLQVNVSSITSNSANISWLPPLKKNGEIKFYTIWKIKTSNKVHKEPQQLLVNETNVTNGTDRSIHFKLISLNSFSEYEVYVTAHTVQSSEKSNSQFFQTLIGTPDHPSNVTLEEKGNYGILKWGEPDMPSGRVDFYVVALVIKYKSKEEEEQQISLVNGRRCKFLIPVCKSTIERSYLKVRAVNVAEKHEIDHSTFRNKILKQLRRRRRHSNPKISATVEGGRQTYGSDTLSSNDSLDVVHTKYTERQKIPSQKKDNSITYNYDDSHFHCLDPETLINVKYANYENSSNNDIKFFPSAWKDSSHYNYCTKDNGFEIAVAIGVPLIMVSAFLAFIFYWLRKKYNKMKNINAVLPEELISQIPNYHLGVKSVEKDSSSNASRSNDCLVTQKESHYLLSSICNGSINGTNPVMTHKNVDDVKDSQSKEVGLSSNICIDEQTSQSTDSVELNDIYALSSNDSTPIRKANMTAICLSLQNEIPALENMVTLSNGYMKPSAIINSDLICNRLPTSPTSGGYVLPAHVDMQPPQHEFKFNGYTTLDAMGKLILPNSMATVSSTPNSSEKNSEHEEIHIKEPDIENTPSRPLYHPPANSNNNNNSNLICGYVTQKQLAQFGQMMH